MPVLGEAAAFVLPSSSEGQHVLSALQQTVVDALLCLVGKASHDQIAEGEESKEEEGDKEDKHNSHLVPQVGFIISVLKVAKTKLLS